MEDPSDSRDEQTFAVIGAGMAVHERHQGGNERHEQSAAFAMAELLYSVRQPKDIIFNTEFRELEKENPHFKFHVTCTRATPEDNWTGRTGRIDSAWVKSQVTDLANTIFYACGPNLLVEFAESLVFELGAPKEQMKTEKWG